MYLLVQPDEQGLFSIMTKLDDPEALFFLLVVPCNSHVKYRYKLIRARHGLHRELDVQRSGRAR